ncbi:hypothetical protein H5410_047717 [Solanum commersonii]|uniref:Uncharacterized protein n=1 Tax=Solanum commersonii TaxID=4109 RepID=A0A9J5XFY7_SOLCO|nr:hypothetical protein H5410_047717 [Solanum commersonii]
MPNVTYEEIHPDTGDPSPISHPIFEFLTSLGTSAGERKLMPTTQDEYAPDLDCLPILELSTGNSSPKYSNQIMNSRSFIIKECKNQNWEGIITRIWPNAKYLDISNTTYCGCDNECYFGLNLNPMCKPSEICYTLLAQMCYFELIPQDSPSRLVDRANVEEKCAIESIDLDKTDEAELQNAVDSAAAILCLYNTSVVEYTST